ILNAAYEAAPAAFRRRMQRRRPPADPSKPTLAWTRAQVLEGIRAVRSELRLVGVDLIHNYSSKMVDISADTDYGTIACDVLGQAAHSLERSVEIQFIRKRNGAILVSYLRDNDRQGKRRRGRVSQLGDLDLPILCTEASAPLAVTLRLLGRWAALDVATQS